MEHQQRHDGGGGKRKNNQCRQGFHQSEGTPADDGGAFAQVPSVCLMKGLSLHGSVLIHLVGITGNIESLLEGIAPCFALNIEVHVGIGRRKGRPIKHHSEL